MSGTLEATNLAYPFAVVKTGEGYSAAALDFPAMVTAESRETLDAALREQAALYLYEAELFDRDPPRPTSPGELDRRRSKDGRDEREIVYVEPAATSYISLAIQRAMKEEAVPASELARRLGVPTAVVRRLMDPFYFGHSTRTLRSVAAALGTNLRVAFDRALP